MSLCLVQGIAVAEPTDAELLGQVPQDQQALQDRVDHWGLPFSEQLRRLDRARRAQREALGDKAPKNFLVGVQHGLEKTPKNKFWFKGAYDFSATLEAARNEYESFQVAVLPELGKSCRNVALTAFEDFRREGGGGSISRDQLSIYRVGFVETRPVQYPTLYRGFWPELLLPNAPMEIAGSDLELFWVELHVPRDATAGNYRGRLRLIVDDESVEIQVAIKVFGFELPDRPAFPLTVWTEPKHPSGKAMSPAEYRELLGEFLAHGVDPLSVGKDFVDLKTNDFSTLDENLEYCLARGLQVFEIPGGGDRPERLKPLVEHLRQKGWMSKAIVYSNQDEPSESQLSDKNIPYRQKMRELYPDLRVFLASQYFPRLAEACDIWMTDVSTGRGGAFAAKHGPTEAVWFYYCHMPLHADFVRPLVHAPNMQIDNEAIEHRLTLWLAWKYQTAGMFIWSGNNEWVAKDVDRGDWRKTGWKLTEKPYPYPLGGVHNGNGYLLYPGPTPSVRLKQLRDGLEDYSYFCELKRRAAGTTDPELKRRAEALLAVPPEVLMDPHYFNRAPGALLKVRAETARLIDALPPVK